MAHNLFSFPSLHLLQKTLACHKAICPVDCPQQNLNYYRKQIAFRAATICKSNTFLVPTGALRRVKRYMCRRCHKPADMKICIFINHLNWMNHQELPYTWPVFGNCIPRPDWSCLSNSAPFRYVLKATYLRSLQRMRSLLCNSISHFILV